MQGDEDPAGGEEMTARALSARAFMWLRNWDSLETGTQFDVMDRAPKILGDLRQRVNINGKFVDLTLIAFGGGLEIVPETVQVEGCSSPVFTVRGLVTTAREQKFEGVLLRRCSGNTREWAFGCGVTAAEMQFIVSQKGGYWAEEPAGLIPTSSENLREVRKQVLGYK
jgi:hypothetical protein